MDINVNINGIKEPLSQAEARRVQNAVKSTIVKEIRNSKDEKSKTVRKPQTLQEVPSFLQAFLTTTHGIITFFIMVFVIAIPASAIGGAMYVASQDTAPIYRISDQTDVPGGYSHNDPVAPNPNLIKDAG